MLACRGSRHLRPAILPQYRSFASFKTSGMMPLPSSRTGNGIAIAHIDRVACENERGDRRSIPTPACRNLVLGA
jgi:hypothetical protein